MRDIFESGKWKVESGVVEEMKHSFEDVPVKLLARSKTELEPQWRDALSGQSSELSVAKANEVDALGNAEVGGGSTSQWRGPIASERD